MATPTELYVWTVGSTTIRETNAFLSVSHGGNTYTPVSIRRTAIDRGTEQDAARLTLTVPQDHAVAVDFRAMPPDSVELEVWQKQSGTYVRIWVGRVVTATWKGSTAELQAEPPLTMARQRGLRGMFQLTCRHRLSDHRCGAIVLGDAYTVSAVSGTSVTLTGLGAFITTKVAAYPANGANWYVGGFLLFSGSRRQILSHSGDVVTLHAPIPDLAVSDSVSLYAGCSHTLNECDAKFSNATHFGGFPFLPPKNPFEGQLR